MLYDIVIIGGGPAGLSAAITARARNKRTLIVSNPKEKNPLASSLLVENYPGMKAVTGLHLLKTMHTQAEELGAEILEARALSIVPLQDRFMVTTSKDVIEGRTILIACGASSGGKSFEGEAEYLGRGVSYCATCDGMLYRSATVLIVGLSDEAAEEANFMAEICETVHFVASKIPEGLDERIQKHSGRLLSIKGNALGVTSAIVSERPYRSAEPTTTNLDVNGIFILRPGVAPTNMLSTLETEEGFIKVDSNMHTNIEGVFAAGDCTGKPMQVAKAVGQGQIAVFSAVAYLG
ncbi:MAG: FAD-dependent oxidoreductase [Coriobacteriia bacterium]|nr:FAD-dependent oxidoreductase [Coriobacteriia bacterium]